MPNINDINGVTIANLSKLDGVTKANIAKVLGITLEAAAAFLLDTYTGAAAGYSVRRIASSATNLMRIREDSGDTETDIGYDSNGDLDTAAIATHCGVANGYVVTWYDQANSNNATQSTAGSQPQIYNGTAVITENGKPALKFDGDKLGEFSLAISQPYSFNYVGRYAGNTASAFAPFFGSRSTTFVAFLVRSNNWMQQSPNLATNSTTVDTDQHNWFLLYDGSSSFVGVDGGTAATSNPGTSAIENFAIGSRGIDSAITELRYFQELVLWSSDQTTNRTGIETDINSEYLIYQPTDAPTSGLLATYTGAAAAYSVRQLSDKAVIALRIRRDSDDVETNIGWDSNGDLDTTAISDFCGTANGYVTRWWDQSTNGNHADQATDASQPQIYNGTAVITENGKPALDWDGTNDVLITSYTPTVTHTAFFAQVPVTSTFGPVYASADTGSSRMWVGASGGNALTIYRGGSAVFSEGTTLSGQYLGYCLNKATVTDVRLGVDGSNVAASGNIGSGVITNLRLGAEDQSGFYGDSRIQEFIIYDSDNSSNKTGIESDINTYFSIYT